MIVAILGRQPTLGLAELESLLGADTVRPLESGTAALVELEPDNFPMARLGGTMKAARYLTELPYTDWDKIEEFLVQELPKHTCCRPPGKIRLGLNAYGFKVSVKRLNATGLTLKKVVKHPPEGEGRSVRVVPNNAPELNTAQVIHNQLTGPTGFDLILIKNGAKTILAQTFAVQDIEAYAARDQQRPKRDARVGMLPPKLAQTIINLATTTTDPHHGAILLDPFCGTGVVLQEAQLMGFDAYGTDLEPRMIEYSQENLAWLHDTHEVAANYYRLEIGDATDFQWHNPKAIRFIACETYLGRPFSGPPTPPVLKKVIQDVDTIHKKFLRNVAKQTDPGFRMCIAVPAWKTKNGFQHLKTLDSLEELGYTRVSFVHVSHENLIYHREDQIVARELVVLIRK